MGRRGEELPCVSFPIATHSAKPHQFSRGRYGCTAEETLAIACKDQHTNASEIFHFSRSPQCNTDQLISNLIPNQNGSDRALVIRPDNFNFFVSARAELLRANLVAHRGKRVLVVAIARQIMATLVEKNVVTLEGGRSDWMDILGRLEKLKEYGLEISAWYHLLRPVIARFVAAFDKPTSPANVDFWQRYTGWITAFTTFSKKGEWLGHRLDTTAAASGAPETLSAAEFWAAHTDPNHLSTDLGLDGTPYHRIGSGEVPPGYGEVDVTLNDDGVVFPCAMVTNTGGTRVSSSHDVTLSSSGEDDTVRPVAGWWLFVKEEDEMEARAYKAYRDSLGY
ncbi:hypothetical protein B0H13DRAFT_2240072 [Mycena leptocephala]|nr:hypothetical protein B0H13DRAFT_2240072 [Mycena leptocephala]